MSQLFPDTDPQAEAVLIALMRDASPLKKLEMMGQLNETAKMLARSGLRSRYPEASEAELDYKLAELLLGPELAARAYPRTIHRESSR